MSRGGYARPAPPLSNNGPHERSIVARKSHLHKFTYLFEKLSLGELQSHAAVLRLIKPGRKPKKGSDLRPIVLRVKIVKGTGIPASTLKRIKNLEIKPGKTTTKKLLQFYNRWQYQHLRAAGANYKDAKNFKTQLPHDITYKIKKYIQNARKIQYNYESTYYQKVKDYKKQEREGFKEPKIPAPPEEVSFPEPSEVPEERPEISDEEGKPLVSEGVFIPSETYLDTEDDEEPEPVYAEHVERLTEPPQDDYPSLNEVLHGMSESTKHDYNDWDDIADTSGTEK